MAAAGIQAASASTLDNIKSHGTIKIGMLVDFPPYGLMNEQNQPDGYDFDVSQALAKYLGVKLDIVPVTGPNRIPYLLSGQVDVLVASLGITPARAKKVDYSKPYAAITIGVYGKKDVDVSKPEDLAGKTIAVARASTQDTAVSKVAPKSANIRRFDSDAAAIQALVSGQVPLIGCSNVCFVTLQKLSPDKFNKKFELSHQVQGIAVRPGDKELLAKINAFIDQAMSNGTLDKISQKWLSEPLPDFLKNGSANPSAPGSEATNSGSTGSK
ncbi:MAG TPA: transporter substrate-binding domain-containing protein [Pararhizobium sp.]|nr:transporter substrate-binding domain-containing protein [Pararhizobium sp.]